MLLLSLAAVAMASSSLVMAQTSGNVPIGNAPNATPCNPTQNPHA